MKNYFSVNKKTHKHKIIYLLPLMALLVLIDNLSKYFLRKLLVISFNPFHSKTISFIPGLFKFNYVDNPGLAFSSFSHSVTIAILISVTVVLVMGIYFILTRTKFLAYPLTFIIAGGIGNLINRTWNNGKVSDFICWDFKSNIEFFNATFNIADSFISVGLVVFLILFVFHLFFWPRILLKKEKMKNESS